jgi:hypothetical protein
MAVTTIKTKKDQEDVILMFMTIPKNEGVGIDIDIFLADNDYEPYGKPSFGTDPRNEEEYHKELRKQASERGEFIPEASTHPEWNAGYVEPENNYYPDGTI